MLASIEYTADIIVFVPGLVVLGIWLLRNSIGRGSLSESHHRRNDMPAYLPLVPILLWFGFLGIGLSLIEQQLPAIEQWKKVLLENALMMFGAVAGIAVIVYLARKHFLNGLQGFGLAFRNIFKDFGVAALNLLAIWPVMAAAISITLFFGRLLAGEQFQMPKHIELDYISSLPQNSVRIVIFLTAGVVVPVFEELLFRGMFQTMVRSFVLSGWKAVAVTSCFFTVVHSAPTHWPALFVLSMCLGYAYEKSGSLWRPIFIHSLFNGTSVALAMFQCAGSP